MWPEGPVIVTEPLFVLLPAPECEIFATLWVFASILLKVSNLNSLSASVFSLGSTFTEWKLKLMFIVTSPTPVRVIESKKAAPTKLLKSANVPVELDVSGPSPEVSA